MEGNIFKRRAFCKSCGEKYFETIFGLRLGANCLAKHSNSNPDFDPGSESKAFRATATKSKIKSALGSGLEKFCCLNDVEPKRELSEIRHNRFFVLKYVFIFFYLSLDFYYELDSRAQLFSFFIDLLKNIELLEHKKVF